MRVQGDAGWGKRRLVRTFAESQRAKGDCVIVVGPDLGSHAIARVSPLSIISRQIHKPNLLVVLDTSGSLTGVPGGSFDTSTSAAASVRPDTTIAQSKHRQSFVDMRGV